MQFFWEKNSKSKGRSRFNLLLLEYGEFYFEDFSAFLYPVPSTDSKDGLFRPFLQCDAMKLQGRLKLCSHSLIFEPIDLRKPLLKFPFKNIIGNITNFKSFDQSECSLEASGFLSFTCTTYFEMKANDKVGPYKQIDASPSLLSADIKYEKDSNSCRVLLAIVHSNLHQVISKIQQLKQIYDDGEKKGLGNSLLRPLLIAASPSTFDTSQLVNFHEKLLLSEPMIVNKIKPLVMYPGCLMITDSRIYFQAATLNNIGDSNNKEAIYELDKITRIYKRRYLLQQIGLEFFLNDQSSAFFVFESRNKRDKMFSVLIQQRPIQSQNPPLETITRRWQRREISNFEYLIYLNTEADRSVNDLTQYPVFPHIIADYTSKTLDLENPYTFRDLSKPIGALNSIRLESFKERFQNMSPADEKLGIPPPFLYGTHYSTPGYVLFYLVRVAPEHMLCLQSGKFDSTDRMFSSIKDMWISCLNNPADLKELIPEFFCGHGEFLLNSDELNMGHKHTGERLGDVELPPWAKTPHEFIRKNIKALESDYVSEHIHEWIDLIFGYKQTEDEAIQADNLFYYLTYEGSVDLEKMNDSSQKTALELQIQEFGQTPKKLFCGPHPRRSDINAAVPVLIRNETLSTNAIPDSQNNGNKQSTKSNKKNVVYLDEDFHDNVKKLMDKEQTESKHDSLNSSLTENPASSTSGMMPFVSFLAENSTVQSFWGSITGNTQGFLEKTFKSSPAGSPGSNKRISTKSNSSGVASEKVNNQPSKLMDSKGIDTTVKQGPNNSLNSQPNLMKSSDGLVVDKIDSLPQTSIPVTQEDSVLQSSDLQIVNNINEGPSDMNWNKLFLYCFEPQKYHSDCITSLSLTADTFISNNNPNGISNITNYLLCSCSKDSVVKVLSIQIDLEFYPKKSVHSSSTSNGNNRHSTGETSTETSVFKTSLKRTFLTGNEPPLSSCIITKDAKIVFTGCWDNSIYSFSIPSASNLSKRLAHKDSVSSLSTDYNNRYILSGSWDSTVKLWEVKSSAGMLSALPIAEFYDHEQSVVCVALEPENGLYAAAGAEDGNVIIWDTKQLNIMATIEISRDSVVTCIQWLPTYHEGASRSIYNTSTVKGGYHQNKIVCGTNDGSIVCADCMGRLFAATRIDSYLRCLSISSFQSSVSSGNKMQMVNIVVGGCDDGSIRLWAINKSSIEFIYRVDKAHTGGCTAIVSNEHIVASGGDDEGIIKIWKICRSE